MLNAVVDTGPSTARTGVQVDDRGFGMRPTITKQIGVLLLGPIGVTLFSVGLIYERFSTVTAESLMISVAGQQAL